MKPVLTNTTLYLAPRPTAEQRVLKIERGVTRRMRLWRIKRAVRAFFWTYGWEIGAALVAFGAVLMTLAGIGGRR